MNFRAKSLSVRPARTVSQHLAFLQPKPRGVAFLRDRVLECPCRLSHQTAVAQGWRLSLATGKRQR